MNDLKVEKLNYLLMRISGNVVGLDIVHPNILGLLDSDYKTIRS